MHTFLCPWGGKIQFRKQSIIQFNLLLGQVHSSIMPDQHILRKGSGLGCFKGSLSTVKVYAVCTPRLDLPCSHSHLLEKKLNKPRRDGRFTQKRRGFGGISGYREPAEGNAPCSPPRGSAGARGGGEQGWGSPRLGVRGRSAARGRSGGCTERCSLLQPPLNRRCPPRPSPGPRPTRRHQGHRSSSAQRRSRCEPGRAGGGGGATPGAGRGGGGRCPSVGWADGAVWGDGVAGPRRLRPAAS